MDKRGFTLVELLTAIGLMGIFFLSVTPFMISSVKSYLFVEDNDVMTKSLGRAADFIKTEVKKSEKLVVNENGTKVEIYRYDDEIIVLAFVMKREVDNLKYGDLVMGNHKLIRDNFVVCSELSKKPFTLHHKENDYFLVSYLKVANNNKSYDLIDVAIKRVGWGN